MSYCIFCLKKEPSDLHRIYHDNHYGFPINEDDELFGRLILEINQAGLSWDIILKKQANFREAFDNFSIYSIANYDEGKVDELLNNTGIIRNKLKVSAVIYNAKQITLIQREFGSFKDWLNVHHPKTLDEWTKLFKKTFKFVGGEIVNEFLMSIGFLKGAHTETCVIFNKIVNCKPKWLEI